MSQKGTPSKRDQIMQATVEAQRKTRDIERDITQYDRQIAALQQQRTYLTTHPRATAATVESGLADIDAALLEREANRNYALQDLQEAQERLNTAAANLEALTGMAPAQE